MSNVIQLTRNAPRQPPAAEAFRLPPYIRVDQFEDDFDVIAQAVVDFRITTAQGGELLYERYGRKA